MTFDIEPHGKLIGAIATQQMDDLTTVLARVSVVDDAKTLTAYSSLNREIAEEAAELLYSAACTASLAGYRREEPSRLVVGSLPEITGILDQIRDELIRLRPSMLRSLRRSRQTVVYARAWATLVLALDASGPDLPTIGMYSGVPARSCDPQGDAQLIAEAVFEDNEAPAAMPPPSFIPSIFSLANATA